MIQISWGFRFMFRCQKNMFWLIYDAVCVCLFRYWWVCRGPDWVPQPLPLCQPARLVPLWMQKWFPWQWILPARWELLYWWAFTELKTSLSLMQAPALQLLFYRLFPFLSSLIQKFWMQSLPGLPFKSLICGLLYDCLTASFVPWKSSMMVQTRTVMQWLGGCTCIFSQLGLQGD